MSLNLLSIQKRHLTLLLLLLQQLLQQPSVVELVYLQQQFEMLKSEEMEHGRSYEFQFSETLDSCHPIFWKQGTCGIGANDDGI